MSNIEQYTEKTVDFKVINSYKKNVNVLNKLAYDTSSKYHELMKFLKQYKLLKEDKQTKPNITSPTGRYLIPEGEPSYQFLNHLKVCHEDKLVLHFRELQTTNFSEDKGSGIMLDFDIYQDNEINAFDKGNVQDFSKAVMNVLANMLDIDRKLESYVGIIIKPKVVYLEDKKLYKNGFHMLIPNIWLTREQKKLFLRQLLSSKVCSEEFVDVFGIGLDKALDMACASVPVYFLHNCKEDAAEPYILKEIYKFRFRHLDGGSTDTGMDSVSREGFEPLKEFSLSFSSSSLKKTFYKFNSTFSKTLEHYVKEKGRFEEEKEQSIAVFDHHNSYSEENLEYYRQLVLEVLNEKRAFDRELWRNTVFAVANISKPLRPALKEIAKQFSMRCESKYDTDAFESIWSDATKDDGKNKLTFNSIVYWAKEDNRAKYDSLLDKDIKTTIELDAYCSKNKVLTGALYQYHFAYYIFHLFKHKFVYDIDGKNGKWFEFVMENDSSKKGEMYKWRHEIKPDNLIIYISNRLPDIVSKVLEKADLRKQTTTEESIIKYLEARSDNLRKSAQSLYKTEFKNGVLKEAESLFRRRGFIDSLDQSENVFGVANGVLIMDDKVEFIQGFHDHPVSLYTEINYRPFDINNKSTKILLKFIISLFPEDEMDMFHYLMYSAATCLDNKPKDSMFLILQGHGCHGVDSPIKMHNGAVKKVQDIKVGDKLMGDDGTVRNVMELFRGEDDMYKITPIKGEKPFIVNKNHVMSLKFTNLNSIILRKDGSYKIIHKYRACWYQLNGSNEPKRYTKMFDSKEEAKEFLENNDKSIKKGDVIDIKLMDLLQWNKWWIEKSNISLYKSDIIKYNSQTVKLDPYFMGAWLGDGTNSKVSITGMDLEIINEIEKNMPASIKTTKYEVKDSKADTFNFVNAKGKKNEILDIMRELNLMNNKHIPDIYKYNSEIVRYKTLAGLLDTDGYYNKKDNNYEISQKSEKLIDDIVEISNSLGINCRKHKVQKSWTHKGIKKWDFYYRTQLFGENIKNIPCVVERKKFQHTDKVRQENTMKFSVEYIGKDNYYGFELDGNHRYLSGDGIVHHNSNGKSSLLELLKTVLGNYGAKVSMSILTENRSGSSGANEQLMAYVNARLAFYSETNKQEEMNCATMKEFTSQESLTGRGIFEKQKTFRPKCNHVITTNFLPIIKTTDYGTWRRLKLYTFKMSFKPERDVDPNNKYEKVADEAVAKMFSRDEGVKEAFLSLLVEYYKHFKHFHKGKFSNILSPTLEKDSLTYRNSMDTMNKFICGNIIISKDSSVSINELVDSYIGFLTEEYGKNSSVQKNEIKQIIMNSALSKFISKDNTAKTIFKGIRLLDTEDEDERLLEGEYFYNSKDNKNLSNSSDAFEYDIKNFDPLGLNEWRKNNM